MKFKIGSYTSTIIFAILLIFAVVAAFYPAVHPDANGAFDTGNLAWMLTASGLVLLMTPGLSFFYGGMVHPRNIISTMLQTYIALGVVSIIWYVFGFSLAFGDDMGGWIGNPFTFFMFDNVGTMPHTTLGSGLPFVLFAAFQMKFAIITPALIIGAFAERIKFWSYLIFMCLFTVFIYCPLAHWTWHPDGFLFKWGVLDFAGGTVVHISAGLAALAGALVLGRRQIHKKNESHQPVNIPYVLLGTGLLWFGWFGFNAGSALAANSVAIIAFMNTMLASASAMLSWIMLDAALGKKPSALGACIGAVVGLVAITPAAGFVDFGPAVFIGFAASVISNFAVHYKSKSDIDDTLDVFPCHGVGGIVGMIFTAVFAKEGGMITGSFTLMGYHLLALIIISAFTFGGSYLLLKLTERITPLRVHPEHEWMGLDISQHGESVNDNEL
jgi:Amt family ammonium transporter